MYGPITALSNVQVDVMTALVSFDRVFEVLDLKPLIADRPGAQALRPRRPGRHRVRPRVLPVPHGQRGVAGLAGVDRAQGPRAERRGPGRPARPDLHRAGRAADGAGRPLGRGQDDDQQPGGPAVRPRLRRDPGRRPRPAGRHPGVAARRGRGGHPGRAHVARHHPGQPGVRAARGDRGRAGGGVPGGADLGPGLGAARRARHDRRAIAATGCRAARSSGWRWPGCCSRPRRWWCSTRPPRTWTPSRRRPCSARCGRRWPAGRRWSSPTGCPPSARPTRSWSSTAARSASAAATTSCWPPSGLYAELYRTQFARQEPAAAAS